MIVEGEYRHIPRYWEWTEDILGRSQEKPQRYEVAPPREEKKSARPESTHNPSGGLPDTTGWSCVEERMFSGLGVKVDKRNETYLAAFLSCWLCDFFLPNKEGDFIRLGTFKMASFMASGRKINLAIPILASIYNGLNKISNLSQLNQIKVCFPIHYFYGWLAHYFRTHYAFSNGHFIPTMVVYSGEDGSRDSFIVDPYSPHRFGRQFGFYQNIPGIMKNDIRSASLDRGLTFWRICTMSLSASRATFPSIRPNTGKSFGSDYQAWWKKTHGKFLDNHLQALVDAARPIPIVHLASSGEVNNKVLNAGMTSSVGVEVPQKRKIISQLPLVASKINTPTQAAYVSKRLLEGESESSSKEVFLRRLRVLDDAIPPAVESCDNASSTSRTITVSLNKENNVATPQ
ncbi:hypothetical protein KY284_032518 [Solanum tuberosum]|nr:hypothetical protein KY284_032518 [Solanum tuberosum]